MYVNWLFIWTDNRGWQSMGYFTSVNAETMAKLQCELHNKRYRFKQGTTVQPPITPEEDPYG